MKRLLHRWFVEYNPLYLLSAMLVLRGVNLLSGALLRSGHTLALLATSAIAEVYEWALIGSAAILLRVGLRRPAVMLALIAVVYQGDLTLHTETCAYLEGAGWAASALWIVSFVLKLVALARALRLRAPRAAFALPTLGAVGLVIVPRAIQRLGAHDSSSLIGVWLFVLFAIGSWAPPRIASAEVLDDWGQTVLRRALRATWTIWAALGVMHAAFWLSSRSLDARMLAPLPLLLGTRYARRPRDVWFAVAGAVALVAMVAPSFFAWTALLGGAAFALHAVESWRHDERVTSLVVGALSSCWLAACTLPAHVVPLDAAFTVAVVWVAWKSRVWSAVVPALVNLGHFAVTTRVVTAPVSPLEWGVWSVAVGFVLLIGTVTATIKVQLRERPGGHPYRTAG